MRQFSADELARRSAEAQAIRAQWQGSYPWRQCANCCAQIHVGGRLYCDECLASDDPSQKSSDLTALTELRDELRDKACASVNNAALERKYSTQANAIDAAITALGEREKMVADKQKPLFAMSLGELNELQGQIMFYIQRKVCGDPRVAVHIPCSAAPSPPKGKGDE